MSNSWEMYLCIVGGSISIRLYCECDAILYPTALFLGCQYHIGEQLGTSGKPRHCTDVVHH